MHTVEAKVQQIFEAWEDARQQGRHADLHALCAGDRGVEVAVRRRIALYEAIDPALGLSRAGFSHAGAPHLGDGEKAGTIVGKYRLLRKLGEGGFGLVYEAERIDGFRERVAVKVLHRGIGTPSGHARFAAEGQALALVRHPNIASVLDAGVSDSGVPYLAMDLIEGEPLTSYCDTMGLDVPGRLELVLAVCDAVGHAHTKGVIHRDLKPANVLVARVDDRPTPKVIDFGIARIHSPASPDHTRITQAGELIGTAAYMSPEQLGAVEGDADTRADIYSIGVMLYEVLCGALPYMKTQEDRLDSSELRLRMRQSEPIHLLSRSRHRPRRSTGTDRNERLEIPRELSWIVMKCLELEPDRRYDTCRELARDIRRYQNGQPLLAAPQSSVYRARKFMQRNRVLVIATTAVALSVIGGLFGTLAGLLDATQARARAEDAAIEAREQARAARFGHYIAGVQAANASLHASDPVAARQSLNAVPEEHRDWEYHYLDYRIDSSLHAHAFPGQMYSVRFGHSDKLWYAVGGNGLLLRFDETGERLDATLELPHQAHTLDVSPAGDRLALGDAVGTVWIVDARTFAIVSSLPVASEPVVRVEFSGNDRLVVSSRDGAVRCYALDDNTASDIKPLWSRQFSTPVFALTHVDGVLWTGDQQGLVRLLDPADGSQLGSRRISHRRIHDIEPIPGSAGVIAATLEGELEILSTRPDRGGFVIDIDKVLNTGLPIAELAMLADASAVLAATHSGGVAMYSLPGLNQLETRFGHEGRVYSVATHPEHSAWATASIDHTVRFWDNATDAPRTVSGAAAPEGIAGRTDFAYGVTSPASAPRAVFSSGASTPFKHQPLVHTQNDSHYIAVPNAGATLRIEPKSGQDTLDLAAWPRQLEAAGLSYEGSTLAVIDREGTVLSAEIKDAYTRPDPIMETSLHPKPYISVSRQTVVVLNEAGAGARWHDGLVQEFQLDIEGAVVERFELLPGGSRVAVGLRWGVSEGVVLRIYDLNTGRMVVTIDSNMQGINTMWTSEDGRQLVVYTRSGLVYRYSIRPSERLEDTDDDRYQPAPGAN
ncbi:MAG: hypothetical protein Tsb0013_03130 [Phycisphaerales bacterium]